jgi:pimeloyl-ACP methyl ester carboxylesterase
MTEHALDIDGIHLAYSDEGEGKGNRTILLIHGHPFDRTMWDPQVEFLRNDFRVVVPDLRGYGKTALPNGCRMTTLASFAGDCLRLLDALGIQEAGVVGLSMGGQIALELFRQDQSRVNALVLADTFAGLDGEETKQLRLTTADRLEREGMAPYAAEVLTKMITSSNAARYPQIAIHVLRMMRMTPPSGAAAALRGRAQRMDYTPLLQSIQVPTLVVVGREDEYTPVTVADELHRSIPRSQLAVIDDAGHLPNLERSAEFNAVLANWLRPCAASRTSAVEWHR